MMRAGWSHAIRARLRQASAGLAVLVLAGCASAPAPAPVPDSQAARLAALLQAAARTGDPRLETAREEMAALESVLTAREAAPQAQPQPQPAAALAPPPDLSRMEPVFHAAHIASYRSLDHAERGWAIYRRNPVLSGHEAAAAEVELDSGRWYRLKVGPFDTRGAAAALCAELEARGDWCAVTDFTGTALAE